MPGGLSGASSAELGIHDMLCALRGGTSADVTNDARTLGVMNLGVIRSTVDAEFRVTGAQTPPWPDPHLGRDEPGEDEYSRVSDPMKYRIIGTRIEAWLRALTALRLATVTTADDTGGVWRAGKPDSGTITKTRWVQPLRTDALALLVCTSGFEGLPDNGVLLGAGTPAVEKTLLPDCGCDACDSGSSELIEELDDHILDVITGAFTHVMAPKGTVQGERDGWSASGPWGFKEVEQVLADARANRSAYPVVSGAAWW